MSISLYDLLDVAPDASADEIRAAWRSAVADLDPTDRRFAVYNEAGSVLLDPERRAAYDAELAGGKSSAPVAGRDDEAALGRSRETNGAAAFTSPYTHTTVGSTRAERRAERQSRKQARLNSRGALSGDTPDHSKGQNHGAGSAQQVPTWVLAVLGVVLVGLVAVSVYLVAAVPADDEITEASREAQGAAERAIVPVLSYDHRSLEADGKAAREWMTEDYQEKYDQLFAQIEETAPETRTVVRTEVVASGLVRSGHERVQVLVFVDRPTRNKSLEEPVVYKDQVRMTMEKVGDRWLVDQLCTTANCES